MLDLLKLKLPEDVLENSGNKIPIYGEVKDNSSIIVITQIGRKVIEAYVCTISDYKVDKHEITPSKAILDLIDFSPIILKNIGSIIEIEGVKYTMACIANKDFDYQTNNWLF